MHRGAHAWLAATYAQLGQLDDARAEAAAVLRLQANYTITGTAMALQSLKSANDAMHYFEGLRKAGCPSRVKDYCEDSPTRGRLLWVSAVLRWVAPGQATRKMTSGRS